jgi:hypothetical protein
MIVVKFLHKNNSADFFYGIKKYFIQKNLLNRF